MKKQYKLEDGMDLSLTLEIDTSIMTPELASDVNGFFVGASDILESADGDVIQAVARRAAPAIWATLLDGYIPEYALEQLGQSEGWPEKHGIRVIDYDVPAMDPEFLDVCAVPVTDTAGKAS